MKLSIIVPVFNSQETIRNTVESILNQSYEDYEVVCVDDGSTDDTGNILEDISKRDSRLRHIKQSNMGVASARNRGLAEASGEFIGFVDSDDTIVPAMFKTMIDAIEDSRSDLVVCGANLVFVSGKHITEREVEYFKPKLSGTHQCSDSTFKNVNVYLWNKVFRSKIIKENNIRFPDGKWYEDSAFVWMYVLECRQVHFVQESLYNYHRSSGSIMGQTFRRNMKVIDHLKIINHISEYLNQKKQRALLLPKFAEYTMDNFALTVRYLPLSKMHIAFIELGKIVWLYKLEQKSRFSSMMKLSWRLFDHLKVKIAKKF